MDNSESRIKRGIRKTRRRKVLDKINDLPDSLLLSILSFLQAKDAVATSLLSKRWRLLWRSLPKLNFDDRSFTSLRVFLQFVDAAIQLVHLNSVQMFVLKCKRFSVPPMKVNIWINALVSYKLTHLELHILEKVIRLPSSVFTCNTISVLKLEGFKVSNLSTVNLPSLKVLHLKRVRFSNPECVAMLLSNCVHLEELVISLSSEIPYDDNSMRNIARFEHLLLAELPAFVFPMEVFSNVQFLHLCEDDVWYGCDDIPTFHNLIHLEIAEFNHSYWTIVSLLGGLPKLQSLIIHKFADYDSDDDECVMELSAPNVPPCVSSQLKEFALFGFEGSKFESEFVKFIMGNARVLRTVIVGTRPDTCEREGFEMLKRLSSYPRCSANCRLIFDIFDENRSEEEMRKFFKIRKLSLSPTQSYRN